MLEITATILYSVGLHARPAARFVQVAKRYSATITVSHGDRTANAKSMVQILALAAKQGTKLRIAADGEDAEQALAALQELLAAEPELEGT